MQHIGLAVFGTAYFGWLGSYLVLLRQFPNGEEWLLLALFSVMATDTGGLWQRPPAGTTPAGAAPQPKKTVEGAIGGLAVGFAAVLLINLLPDLQVALWKMIILGLALPIAAQLGDLAESTLKRTLGVKDLGVLVPGHGGIPDRLDSLLFGIRRYTSLWNGSYVNPRSRPRQHRQHRDADARCHPLAGRAL